MVREILSLRVRLHVPASRALPSYPAWGVILERRRSAAQPRSADRRHRGRAFHRNWSVASSAADRRTGLVPWRSAGPGARDELRHLILDRRDGA
jgi:hypothetical protein